MKPFGRLFLSMILTSSALCWPQVGPDTLIRDPGLSRRCKELLKERQDKIKFKQKAQSLIERNKALRKFKDPNRVSAHRQLQKNFDELKKEELLIILKIEVLEEKIVRSGCPGIVLQ